MQNFKYNNKSFIMPMSAFVLIVEFILSILFAMNKYFIFSTKQAK